MSELSYRLLSGAIDYADVAERRRRITFDRLCPDRAGVVPRLPDEVVPLGFPVRLSGRDRVRQGPFRARDLRADPLADRNLRTVQLVAITPCRPRILTLPCDQR